jgi:hypothetical protein
MPDNPASIVRLLYGERAAEVKKRAEAFSLQCCRQQFDIRHSHRSSRRSTIPEMESVLRSRLKISSLLCYAAKSWLDRLLFASETTLTFQKFSIIQRLPLEAQVWIAR